MKDLVLHPSSKETVTITEAEQQVILDANEEEDTIGVEADLKALFESKYSGTVPVHFHVRCTTPAYVVVFAYTANKNWWAK